MSVSLVCTVLTTSTAASVYVASDPFRRTTAERAHSAMLPASSHRQDAAVRALVDSLVMPLGVLPVMDSVMLRYGVGFLSGRHASSAWIDFDTAEVRSLDTLGFLRQWSRSAPLPPFWGYRPGFGGATSVTELPIHSFQALKRFVLLNEAAADSALLARNPAVAMTRARETLSGARHLLAQPVLIDMLVAHMMLQRGARLLARSAQQGDDPLTAGAAKRLDALAMQAYAISKPQLLVYTTLGAEPRDGRLVAVAGDRAMHPALRLRAFDGLLAGACLRPREMLFGLSDERRIAFQQMANAIEDMPRAPDLVRLYDQMLTDFDDGPTRRWDATNREWQQTHAAALPLSWVIPRVVRERVATCRMLM